MILELAYRFEATLTEVVPIGLVPEGIRLDAFFKGSITEGLLSGATLRGIDYLLLRADGVGVINVYEVISTSDGRHISVHAQGYSVPPAGMQLPAPEVLLSPGFQWPDVPVPLHGFALARTGAREFEWLNRTALAFEGSANVGTGQLLITAHALVPEANPGHAH
jgi:hypothetical protein